MSDSHAQARPYTGYGIAALVLGLLWMWGLGSVLAIVFGVMGQRECDRGERAGRGFATVGVVLGVLGVLGAVLVTFFVLFFAGGVGGSDSGGIVPN